MRHEELGRRYKHVQGHRRAAPALGEVCGDAQTQAGDVAMRAGPGNLLEAARNYLGRGYVPIPVGYRDKAPLLSGWTKLQLTDEQLEPHFRDGNNIGLLLGEPSGWLVDVDLDCEEAIELADEYLPATDAVTGRESRPRSHRWYIAAGAMTTRHKDPSTKAMIVELRSTGAQTLVGPSVHPDGELYDMLEGEPAVVDAAELARAVEHLAAAVLERRGHTQAALQQSEVPFTSAPTRSIPTPTGIGHDEKIRRASAYLRALPPSIARQGGHDRAFAAATAVVHGFEVEPDDAMRLLEEHFNPRCDPPWAEKELRHKVDDALTKPHTKPRGWLLHASSDRNNDEPESEPPPPPAFEALGSVQLGDRDPQTGKLVLSPILTLPTARAFVREHFSHPHGPTLVYFAGEFYAWRKNCYRRIENGEIENLLLPWLNDALQPASGQRGSGGLFTPFPANPRTVDSTIQSLRSETFLPESTANPSWLNGRTDRPCASEILACKTMNFHVPTGEIIEPTPSLFTMSSLDFDLDPSAAPPKAWLHFLDELFGDDAESIELLQQWFGYSLLPDTSQHKMLLIVGPKRSGKGTLARVLRRLVGERNIAGPTTGSLAGQFGLQQLIGKSLAIISDARFRCDQSGSVMEHLLTISGEDAVSINRKYLPPLTCTLPTRVMILSNEVPKFDDPSGAIQSRFLLLRLTRTFYGQEDHGLLARLLDELPGILLWAVRGWSSLQERGRFAQPTIGDDLLESMQDLGSPVGRFIKDFCVTGDGLRVDCKAIYARYTVWCTDEGISPVPSVQMFGKQLFAALPTCSLRRSSGNLKFYDGISLKKHPDGGEAA